MPLHGVRHGSLGFHDAVTETLHRGAAPHHQGFHAKGRPLAEPGSPWLMTTPAKGSPFAGEQNGCFDFQLSSTLQGSPAATILGQLTIFLSKTVFSTETIISVFLSNQIHTDFFHHSICLILLVVVLVWIPFLSQGSVGDRTQVRIL